ncbi:MAG: methyltransferase domain-containing protein [Halobacteriales archaeon]|nr:methyltransferase domain-containing protein [Halobacteriales archaeon]
MGLVDAVGDALTLRARMGDVPRVRALAQVGPTTRLLDVGGGTGAITARVAEGAAKVWVLEPHPRKVRHGRGAQDGMAFLQASAERIPLPDQACDVVLAIVSLHHVPDAPAALREAWRVLAHGGRLVVQESDPATDQGRRLAHVEAWLGTGATFRVPEEWCALLREAGFRDVAWERARRGFFVHARR